MTGGGGGWQPAAVVGNWRLGMLVGLVVGCQWGVEVRVMSLGEAENEGTTNLSVKHFRPKVLLFYVQVDQQFQSPQTPANVENIFPSKQTQL